MNDFLCMQKILTGVNASEKQGTAYTTFLRCVSFITSINRALKMHPKKLLVKLGCISTTPCYNTMTNTTEMPIQVLFAQY